jgi:hypothetical protein
MRWYSENSAFHGDIVTCSQRKATDALFSAVFALRDDGLLPEEEGKQAVLNSSAIVSAQDTRKGRERAPWCRRRPAVSAGDG